MDQSSHKNHSEIDWRIFDQADQGIFVLNRDGIMIYSNAALFSNLNENPDALIWKSSQSYLERKMTDSSGFGKMVETGRDVRVWQKYVNYLGDTFEMLAYHIPIFVRGELVYDIGFLMDVRPLQGPDGGDQVHSAHMSQKFIYKSVKMAHLIRNLRKSASLPVNILLLGDTGVGKDTLAEYIHNISDRQGKPFVKINAAAIPEQLLESELFGYTEGAFTGAQKNGKLGLMEKADGGTLYLDEINSLPIDLQGKLLAVIENKAIRRIGSVQEREVDFRLISASNEDLITCIRNKTFREDLYFRLSVLSFSIPPLRERREDIIPLAEYFWEQNNKKYGKQLAMSPELVETLQAHDWPGNVRELKNYIERFIILDTELLKGELGQRSSAVPGGEGRSQEFLEQMQWLQANESIPLAEKLAAAEKYFIQDTMNRCGSMAETAQALEIDSSTLSRKISKYGLRSARKKRTP